MTAISHESPAHREFAYRPQWGVLIASGLICGIGGYFFQAEAASNDRGLIINGIIELSTSGATTFYLVFSWLLFALVTPVAFLLIARLLNPQTLVLADDGLYLPKRPWSREPTLIRYGDIRGVLAYEINGQQLLDITHAGGVQHVPRALFESAQEFDEFTRELARRRPTA